MWGVSLRICCQVPSSRLEPNALLTEPDFASDFQRHVQQVDDYSYILCAGRPAALHENLTDKVHEKLMKSDKVHENLTDKVHENLIED